MIDILENETTVIRVYTEFLINHQLKLKLMIDILVNETIVIRVYTEFIINHQLKLKTND